MNSSPPQIKTHQDINSQQLADCLAIIGHLNNQLQADNLCPNVKTSIEGTILIALNRIDALIQDNTRWGLPEKNAQALGATAMDYQNSLQLHQVLCAQLQQRMAFGPIEDAEVIPAPKEAAKPRKKTK